jgi:hypothetical protein
MPRSIWFNDEAHIHLNGYVNEQNKHVWASKHLRIIMEALLSVKKFIACCALKQVVLLDQFLLAIM